MQGSLLWSRTDTVNKDPFLFETPGISMLLICKHLYIVSHLLCVCVCVCVGGGGGVGGEGSNTEVKWEGNISRIKGAEEREDLVLRGLLQKKW